MTCHPGFIKIHFSNARYKRHITGEGPSPQQQKKNAVNCPKCNKKMNKASLLAHMERIHGEPCMVLPELPELCLASHQPREYIIRWPRMHKKWPCHVEGCPYQTQTNTNFHKDFMHRYPYDSIHVADEFCAPWRKCELLVCGLQCAFPTFSLHKESAICTQGWITKQSRDTANHILWANEQVFTVDGTPTESVGSFWYQGRVESCT